jgi:hypothetical protein
MSRVAPTAADSAETIGRVFVVLLELVLGALALFFARRFRGVWGVALTAVGVLFLLLVAVALFS